MGWALLAAGAVLAATGIVLQAGSTAMSFDPRILTGLGILSLGVGVAALLRGGVFAGKGDAMRLAVEEQDERNVAIRRLAGSRAFRVSAALTYILLMWVSFSGNGQLPALSPDGLWWALMVAFVVPVVVYVVSIAQAQRSM